MKPTLIEPAQTIAPMPPLARYEVAIDKQLCYEYALDVGDGRYQKGQHINTFAVSTAKKGVGERINSYQTPRGLFHIRAKIGAGQPPLMAFKRRRPTGEICSRELFDEGINKNQPRDWILGRILWLGGLEPCFNRYGPVDTLHRFIYFHGCPPWTDMTQAGSNGCIRVLPDDMMALFNQSCAGHSGDKVLIRERDDDEFDVVVLPWSQAQQQARFIREQVFQIEQGISKNIDEDVYDESALHIVVYHRRRSQTPRPALTITPVGTARWINYGDNEKQVKIGRMAVIKDFRHCGLGVRMMQKLMMVAHNCGIKALTLNSQHSVVGFYQKLGFVQNGKTNIEAGIEHLPMVLELSFLPQINNDDPH